MNTLEKIIPISDSCWEIYTTVGENNGEDYIFFKPKSSDIKLVWGGKRSEKAISLLLKKLQENENKTVIIDLRVMDGRELDKEESENLYDFSFALRTQSNVFGLSLYGKEVYAITEDSSRRLRLNENFVRPPGVKIQPNHKASLYAIPMPPDFSKKSLEDAKREVIQWRVRAYHISGINDFEGGCQQESEQT